MGRRSSAQLLLRQPSRSFEATLIAPQLGVAHLPAATALSVKLSKKPRESYPEACVGCTVGLSG